MSRNVRPMHTLHTAHSAANTSPQMKLSSAAEQCARRWLKFCRHQLDPIIPLKVNKDVLRKLHANSIEINEIRLRAHATGKKTHNTTQKRNKSKTRTTPKNLHITNRIGSYLIWIKHRTILVKQISTRIELRSVCVFFSVLVFGRVLLLDHFCMGCAVLCCVYSPCCGFVSIMAIHCSWQCFHSCLARDAVSRSKTLTRNECSSFFFSRFQVENDLQMPRDHIIQSGSCTSFEYSIQLDLIWF